MTNAFIYVTYDSSEYVNYFALFVNETLICSDIPYEKIDKLFSALSKTNNDDSSLELCIVANENASEWNFINDFEKYNCKLNAWNFDEDSICSILSKHFGGRYSIKNNGIDDNTVRHILVLYPNDSLIFCSSKIEIDQKELIDKASEILNSNSIEKTMLAKIIEEKYAKMKGNE